MKTITALLTAILIAVATSLSAQSDPIFWFNVKVFNKVDKHSRQKQYDVRPFSTKISNGSIKAFSKALWKCTATGQSIAIGPFKSYTQAEAALKLYKMVNDTITPRNKATPILNRMDHRLISVDHSPIKLLSGSINKKIIVYSSKFPCDYVEYSHCIVLTKLQ